MAGSVSGYSNQALALLAAALSQFARPLHPDKSLEELQQLLLAVENSEPRSAAGTRARAINTERKLGDERVAELLIRYTEGASAHAMSQEFGIATANVMRLVRKHGLGVHERLPSSEIITKAAELYESGLSLQRVADKVKVPKSTIRKALLNAGLTLREPRHR